jgi:hypothetical protein
MNELTGYIKTSLFHFRRIFMSPQERYAQLWARTKKLGHLSYGLQNTVADSNK